jgi:integrase
MASIHKRLKSPYWTCEYRAADGRWLKRSTKLKERPKALKWCLALQEAQDKICRGSASKAQLRAIISDTMEKITGAGLASPTLRDWFEQWLAGKAGANSPSTLIKYRQAVADFLNFMGQKASGTLESVQQRDVIAFCTFLREQGMSPRTINQLVAKIIAAPFRQAFAQGIIRHNPVAGIPRLSEQGQTRKQAFTLEQIQRLVAVAQGEWKGAILAGYTTGMRLGDVVSLAWENIDFGNNVIAFHQGKTQTKGDDATVIGLHPDFEEYLKGLKVRALTGPIFPSLAGRKSWGRSGLSMEFERIMAKTGIESPHRKIHRHRSGDRTGKVVPHTPATPEFIRPAQAPLYGISRSTAYNWLNAGLIRSTVIRLPGNVRGVRLISVESIKALFTKGKVPNPSPLRPKKGPRKTPATDPSDPRYSRNRPRVAA